MKISVVSVLHDSARSVGSMLESLSRLGDADVEVICVDSGSRDDGPGIARARGARVIELGSNPGYGAACNAGVDAASGEACVLLNPDTVILDDGLVGLAGVAIRERVILAPRLLNADGTLQRTAHPLPGRPSALLGAVLPPRLMGRLGLALEPYRSANPVVVGWAIGACLVASTALLRELGPFDPEVFLYGEDMELCLRARALGVPTIYRPDVAVVHEGGHSTEASIERDRRLEIQAIRRREVISRELGPSALALDDATQKITFGTRALVGRRRAENLAQLSALRRAQNSPS